MLLELFGLIIVVLMPLTVAASFIATALETNNSRYDADATASNAEENQQ